MKRKVWKIPGRPLHWWVNLVSGITPREGYARNLRIDIGLFEKLYNELRGFISPDSNSFQKDTLSAKKRFAIVLYYLKDQGSLRMTANTFGVNTVGVSVAIVSVSFPQVCDAICKIGPKFNKFPQKIEEIRAIASRFEEHFYMPQVIGCIDGTHISNQKPHEDPHDFFCYKMKYSLNCQAICDEKGVFLDFEVRWPGSVHDARVYANSNVNRDFQDKELALPYKELVPGCAPVPPFLIGDPAYPLLPNVMKEFSVCRSDKEKLFNNYRATRNQIEFAFGRLTARWRILNRTLDLDLKFATLLIYSCFILHNSCEINSGNDLSQDAVQHYVHTERRLQSCYHHGTIDKLYSYISSRGRAVRGLSCSIHV